MATLITLDPNASPLRRASIAGLQTAGVGDVIPCRLVLAGDARSGAAGYSPVVAVGFPGVVLGFGENFVAATGGWDFTLRLDTDDLAAVLDAGAVQMMGLQVTITGPSGARVTEGHFDISIFRPVEIPGDLIPVPGSVADALAAGIADHEDRIAALEAVPPGSAAGVSSVNGRDGAVTLTKADVGLPNVDDTADSAKPVSTAQSAAISAEASVRASVDAALSSRVSTLEAAGPGGVGDVTEAELSTAISVEASARTSVDASLSAAISAEVSARVAADTGLASSISTETSLRVSVDASLSTAISAETSVRASADSSLASRISAEEAATVSLSTRISAEEVGRASVDSSLESRISTEEGTRGTAVSSLASRISTEESVRASVDTSLSTAIAGGGGGGSGGGTKTIAVVMPREWMPPATSFATIDTRNSLMVQDYLDSADTSLVAQRFVPEGTDLSAGVVVDLWMMATSATTGNVRWRVEFARLVGQDIDSFSWSTATEATLAASATSGQPSTASITVAAGDLGGIVAGEPFLIRLTRVGTDATNDTLTDTAEKLCLCVRRP